MAQPIRILFLARRYPPTIGGIQTHCHALYTQLVNQAQVRLIALGRQSLLHLTWFLPYCFVVALWAVLFRRVHAIYFADGVAASLAPLLRPLGPVRFITTVYGLEMTYKNPLARALMQWGVRACDKVVVISEHSRRITAASGVPEAKLEIIYLGVEPLELSPDALEAVKTHFEEEHGLRFGQDRIVLLFGRQVPRKGMVEFLEKGMPLLDADIRLLICGPPGSETTRLETFCQSDDLKDRVVLLGPVPDDVLAMLRTSCDLFLMPNIHIPGDVEGFGQTQLECMYAGTPAVAFAVDALTESVREGGFLVDPENYPAFVAQIHRFFALSPAERTDLGRQCRAYVQREYAQKKIAAQYMKLFIGNA